MRRSTGTARRGAWRENTVPTGQAWGLPAVYSVDDHFPRRCIAALAPECVQNEYGD